MIEGEEHDFIEEDDKVPGSPVRHASGALPPQVPSSRVDRLLLQRLRKSQSATTLYGDSPNAVPDDYQEPSVYTSYDPEASQRLLVVANRLPVSASRDKDGKWSLQMSAGGLVSALLGVQNLKTLWIGWPGCYVEEGPSRDALTEALLKEHCIPVYMDAKTVDLHYNGFCNSVLWQLFHYVPLNMDSKLSETRTLQFQWAAYQDANKKFADVVFRHTKPGDVVWAQDYHLMLLPALLKARNPKMKVGWFLHTPFPSSEIYRTLPVREEVLRAVLKADLIGFHTYDYARHFVSACTRILGLEGTPEGVEDNGQLTRVAAFPIGIDPERFAHALERPDVRASTAQLKQRYAGRKVMLGVDRLDMIKGIPQKLLAFEKFLEEHPEWRDKVLLVQIAVPSRTDVPEYQHLRSMVHEIVGRINGHFGTLTHVPIHHLDRQLSFHELCALYAVTDVALITSLRDGMNLVSYEFVACQSVNAVPGVLVLSEFAGAAQSLGAGAILVNPWNITDMAAAIEDALAMSEQERRERHRQNYMHITIHTSQAWADTFITELNDTHVEAELRTRHVPPQLDVGEAVANYRSSHKRLLVLGYNATLTTAVEAPRQPKRHFDQIKALSRMNPMVYNSVKALCEDPNTTVIIFSGTDKAKLEEAFGSLNLWLVAENGIFMRPPPSQTKQDGDPPEWEALMENTKKEWMESVRLVFDYFCERTPRSFVEARETSVVWNYKYADVEFGRLQARDLLQHLWTGPISNAPVDIVQGAKSVEVRPVGVSKGLAMQHVIAAIAEAEGVATVDFDFVLVVGHFLVRDENIFTFFEGGGHRPVPNDGASAWGLPGSLPRTFNARQSGLTGPYLQHSHSGGGTQPPHSKSAPLLGAGRSTSSLNTTGGTSLGRLDETAEDLDGIDGLALDDGMDDRAAAGPASPPSEPPSTSQAAGLPLVPDRRSPHFAPSTQQFVPGADPSLAMRRSTEGPVGFPGTSARRTTTADSVSNVPSRAPSALPSPITVPNGSRGFDGGLGTTHRDRLASVMTHYGSLNGHFPAEVTQPLFFPPKHLYTCTVGRSRASAASYFLAGSVEVGVMLADMAGLEPGTFPGPDDEFWEEELAGMDEDMSPNNSL